MWSSLQLISVLIAWAGAGAVLAGSPNDGHRSRKGNVSPGRFPGSRSWDSHLYPDWSSGDWNRSDCWKGGSVSFQLSNDAPTLTGAKSSFYIDLKFPVNQSVQADGEVVWAENCTVNGTHVRHGDPVYPSDRLQEADGVFPDGKPFPGNSARRRSKFVFVWQTLGKYWQTVDGPSSVLVVDTAEAQLGSYTMEVVVYHYRGHRKFVPLGKATSQFTITDRGCGDRWG
eukprot:gi/632982565/ref/XP_007908205.1/ PREDICTED: melanocyte protein PMEL-like [Callorhinchus milii]